MKEKIIAILGPAVTARLEKRAAAQSITDALERGEAQARLELPDGTDEEIAERAGMRALQIVGLIPGRPPKAPDVQPAEPQPSPEPVLASAPETPGEAVPAKPKKKA